MVCKECGAYNADHLTHCRVCAAKLKDAEPAASQAAEEPGRPSRRFAQAPAWPKEAFAGAAERASAPKAAEQAPAAAEAEKSAPAEPAAKPAAKPAAEPAAPAEAPAAQEPEKPAQEPRSASAAKPAAPAAKPAAPAAEPAAARAGAAGDTPRFCANCGKELFPGAPFCAFCGTRAGAAPQSAAQDAVKQAGSAPLPEAVPEAAEETAPARGASRRFGKRTEKPEEKPAPKKDYASLYEDDVDDFDDDEYDDEYYDDDEAEDAAPAGKGGKGSTILFWALIVVLVALIGGLGWYVVSRNGGLNQFVSNIFGGPAATADPNASPDPNAGQTVTVNGVSATIESTTTQDGQPGFNLIVSAPNGSVVRIITKATVKTNEFTISQDNRLTLEIPQDVFLPYDYAETETVSVTPEVEVTLPDGTVTPLSVPAVSLTLPRLNLTITEPASLTVEQKPDNGAITISGTVDNHTAEVLVNDTLVPVYEGGVFQTEVVPEVDPETGGQIVVTARKENYVTATQTVAVTPYVVKDLTMAVTTPVTDLRAEDNTVTVEGTVVAGATVKVTCESEDVTCGETIVTANGTFSCPVTIAADGFYELTITGTLDGYNEGKATCIVERAPTSSNGFRNECTNITSVYDGLVAGTNKTEKLLVTGKIKEILSTSPYTIVRVELSDGKEVIVCNRSLKNTLADDDIGRTKQIAGSYAGLYNDTQTPYVWGWFIWNK